MTNQAETPESKHIKFLVPPLLTQEYVINSDETAYFQQFDPEVKEGDAITQVAAASYLNYVVTNGMVLMPKYSEEGSPADSVQRDMKAKILLEKYFPDQFHLPPKAYKIGRRQDEAIQPR